MQLQHLLLDPDLLRLHLGDLPISSKSQLLCRKCRESDILTQSVNILYQCSVKHLWYQYLIIGTILFSLESEFTEIQN